MNPWLKFALVQIANLVLMILGLPICAVLAAIGHTVSRGGAKPNSIVCGWPKPFWIWSNDEDGIWPGHAGNRLYAFYWTAIRNPVDNLKYVPGVATPGGPLLYKTWFWFGKQFYLKIGYMPHQGYPALSAGAGRGY